MAFEEKPLDLTCPDFFPFPPEPTLTTSFVLRVRGGKSAGWALKKKGTYLVALLIPVRVSLCNETIVIFHVSVIAYQKAHV